jgi:hypothetical protein
MLHHAQNKFIRAASFSRSRLLSLDLSMCGLGALKPSWFEGMEELRMLNLEYNRLGLGWRLLFLNKIAV